MGVDSRGDGGREKERKEIKEAQQWYVYPKKIFFEKSRRQKKDEKNEK